MTNDLLTQQQFAEKVRGLSLTLINYKQTKDKEKQYFKEILVLKEEVLTEGHNLGLSDEMVIGMLIDMTKEQLSEWYVKKLFSEDFNTRRMLHKNSEFNSNNDTKKDLEDNSRMLRDASKTKIPESINLPTVKGSSIQSDSINGIFEFDLVPAIKDVIMPHIEASSKYSHYIVKATVTDGIVIKMDHEESKLVTYDYVYKMEVDHQLRLTHKDDD